MNRINRYVRCTFLAIGIHSGSHGNHHLMDAVSNGNVEIVREMLKTEKGKKDLHKESNFITPLGLAITNNNTAMVELLLSAGASVSAPVWSNYTTPLVAAVQKQNFQIMRILLEKGADANEYVDDLSCLHHVIGKAFLCDKNECLSFLLNATDLLLKYGAKINATAKKGGSTPLHMASGLNLPEVTKFLLSCGANIDEKNIDGKNSIDVAQEQCALDSFDILFDYLKPSRKKNIDLSVLKKECSEQGKQKDFCAWKVKNASRLKKASGSKINLEEALISGDIGAVEKVLPKGSINEIIPHTHSSPLYYAAFYGDVKMVEFLLSRGANPNQKISILQDGQDSDDIYPLFAALAVVGQDKEKTKDAYHVIKCLLEHGANPNVTTYQSITPLHMAVTFNEPEIAKILCDHGANIDAQTSTGENSLDIAQMNNFSDMFYFLSKYQTNSSDKQVALNELTQESK